MAFNSVDQTNPASLSNPTHSPLHPSIRRRGTKWGIGFSLLLLTGGGYFTYRHVVPQQADLPKAAVAVERANLPLTVSANGTVEPEKVINVSPKNAGIMTALLVKEGDRVTKGQILARMDDSNFRGQLLQEQGKLARAEANLSKLIAGNRSQDIGQAEARLEELNANLSKLMAGNRPQEIAQAQARLTRAQTVLSQAEDDFRRTQNLYTNGAISLQAANQKRSDRDSAQAQVNEAQQALSLQKAGTRQEDIEQVRAQVKQQQQVVDLQKAGTRAEDIEQARADVTTARGSLQSIQTQIDDTLIRAPFSGIVISKYADPGAFVTPMTAGSSVSSATSSSILSLASANQVAASVSESKIAQVRVGQPVIIKADAYPGKTFEGKVSQVATEATVSQNVTSFKVEIAILFDPEKQLRSGMNTSVEFQVGQVEQAITVPTIAVTRQQNVTGVFVGDANHPPRFVPITTGATVNNRTEVKSGLDGTEKVLITLPPKPKSEGLSLPALSGSTKDGPPGGAPGGAPSGGAPSGPPP